MTTGSDPRDRGVAAIYDGTPGAFVWRTYDIPTPLAGERLVRVRAATVCGSDLHTWEGRRTCATPTILGHEIVGEIVASAPDCPVHDRRGRPLAIGSRVTWGIVAACGTCEPCRRHLPQKCRRGVKYGHERAEGRRLLTGGLAGHCLLAPGTEVVALDDALPLAVACPASCATATVAGAVAACGPLAGAVVGILGCGMLGLTAAAMVSAGGGTVIAVDPGPRRCARALRFGATRAVSPDDCAGAAAAIAPGGLDAVIEVSGRNAAFMAGVESLRVGGTIVLVGSVSPAPDVPVSLEGIVRRCLTIRGLHNYRPEDLVAAVEFLERHHRTHPFAELVSAWFPLGEVAAAFRAAADPAHVRVGITPEPFLPSETTDAPP
jgi:putative phosphonate catabolism associated alcohol dehydrogenase